MYFKSTDRPIYKNRKVSHLSTYGGSEGEKGYSYEEEVRILEYFFKKVTKSLINGDGLIKR